MKFKIIAALSLLTIVNLNFAGIFFNAVPVKITFKSKPFYFSLEGTNNKDDYPTFRKTEYGRFLKTEYSWFNQRLRLIDQDGTYPELTRLFIPAGEDKFIYDANKNVTYKNAILNIPSNKILQRRTRYSTETEAEFVNRERKRLTDALQVLQKELSGSLTGDIIIEGTLPQYSKNIIQAYLNPYTRAAWLDSLPDMTDINYNLYGSGSIEQQCVTNDYKIVEKCLPGYWFNKRLRPAYKAVQKFCKELGVETPSIDSYYDTIFSGKGLATGAALGAGAAALWYKSKSGQ